MDRVLVACIVDVGFLIVLDPSINPATFEAIKRSYNATAKSIGLESFATATKYVAPACPLLQPIDFYSGLLQAACPDETLAGGGGQTWLTVIVPGGIAGSLQRQSAQNFARQHNVMLQCVVRSDVGEAVRRDQCLKWAAVLHKLNAQLGGQNSAYQPTGAPAPKARPATLMLGAFQTVVGGPVRARHTAMVGAMSGRRERWSTATTLDVGGQGLPQDTLPNFAAMLQQVLHQLRETEIPHVIFIRNSISQAGWGPTVPLEIRQLRDTMESVSGKRPHVSMLVLQGRGRGGRRGVPTITVGNHKYLVACLDSMDRLNQLEVLEELRQCLEDWLFDHANNNAPIEQPAPLFYASRCSGLVQMHYESGAPPPAAPADGYAPLAPAWTTRPYWL
ncbi:hypothetical protein AURDEDRAFT_177182 [Auricularia subglabra TFB-10046 SS5]|uniref:Piwi domain-containing protein n=1 Tax=Auricularia subglabra (strain TFB-10046 / SS5) TaxID=717982 RepID=J0WN03_AURST|nr:hypothetical protein AURDEDRAFT_177182 [Auricularia subglabra TFB-10046 SS5]